MMNTWLSRFVSIAFTGLLACLVAACLAPPATQPTPSAQPELPTVGLTQSLPGFSANVIRFAGGLVYPRGLKFGPDGNLYVAISGNGGDTETMGVCEDYTSIFAPYHIGYSAQVVRLDAAGEVSLVAQGLPSARDQFGDVLGVSDIAFVDEALFAVISGGGCSRGFTGDPASVVRVNADGSVTRVVNLSEFFVAHPAAAGNEEDYEPDGAANSVLAYDGKLYVINANHGGLDEVQVDGEIRRLLDITASQGHTTPAAIAEYGGEFYVGTLGEFPIRAGTSKIYRLTPAGDLSIYAEGLTAVLGLAFDSQGRLYALEATTVDSDYPPPGSGRIVLVSETGSHVEIASGFSFPIGMTFGPDGYLYVSNYGFGGDPTLGEVLRVAIDQVSRR